MADVHPEPETTTALTDAADASKPERARAPADPSDPDPDGAAASVEAVVRALEADGAACLRVLRAALLAPLDVLFARLPGFDDVPVPFYAHPDDAGMDVFAAFPDARQTVAPGAQILVDTGWTVAVPPGWQIEARTKSGRALREELVVANSPGTVDAGYRGPLRLIVKNHSHKPRVIERLSALGQIVVMPAQRARPRVVDALPDSESGRGEGGFGSTGLAAPPAR